MPEKSVAEIVAEIKAKVYEIDARLSTIRFVNPKKNLAFIWDSLLLTWERFKKIPDDLAVEKLFYDKRKAVFDLRVPLNAMWSYVQLLLIVDKDDLGEELSPQTIRQLQAVDQIAKEISELYKALENSLHNEES